MPGRRDILPIRAALCVVAGLATTVGVAAAMRWLPVDSPTLYRASLPGRPHYSRVWRIDYFGGSDFREETYLEGSQYTPRRAREIRGTFLSATWNKDDPKLGGGRIVGSDVVTRMVESGWPCHCFWGVVESTWAPAQEHRFGLYVTSALPVRPRFRGGSCRTRRSHCPHCNCSLAGIAPSACPECGNPYQYVR